MLHSPTLLISHDIGIHAACNCQTTLMRLILDTTECKIDGDASIGNDTSRLFLEVDKLLHEIKAFFKDYTKNGRQVTALFEASIGYVPIMTQKNGHWKHCCIAQWRRNSVTLLVGRRLLFHAVIIPVSQISIEDK